MDLGLSGRRVLVSGGSRGTGKAIVECFLQEGASVAFCARGPEGVKAAQNSFGPGAFGQAVDVTEPSQIKAWIDSAAESMGGIDIIVPNVSALAGGSDLETWNKAFQTDLLGTVSMFQAALPYLKRSDAAAVVLMSSLSGREVDIFAEPYGVLKAALIHYGKPFPRGMLMTAFGSTPFRRATCISRTAYGARSRGSSRIYLPNALPQTRWDAWPRLRKWPAPRCSSPVQPLDSPPAPTCSSTAAWVAAFSSEG